MCYVIIIKIMFKIQTQIYSVCLLFYLVVCVVSTSSLSKTTHVDLIIQGLEEPKWLKDEEKCLEDTYLLLRNVKNHTLWATWIWNSNQLPVGTFYGSRYSLGNYDQCLNTLPVTGNPVIRTQYCLADVKLSADKGKKRDEKANLFGKTEEFLSFKNKNGRVLNLITWGTCQPASCKPESIAKILKIIYLINPITSEEPEINIYDCQLAGEKTVYNRQFYGFLVVTVSLVVAAILSTFYQQYTNKDTKMTRIANSFSLRRNWSSFTRISGDEIPVLNFTKSILVILCTCAHSTMFKMMAGVSNGVDVDNLLSVKSNMVKNTVHHIDMAFVENFFVMSGLLVTKSLMEKKKNPIIVLIQRYIRLVGSFAFTVFYCIAVSKYTGDGPLWNKLIGREQNACEENWIWSLLMLNNYVKAEGLCRLTAWYLPCDYHLAVLGTGVYIIWKWNKRAGKLITIGAAVLAVVTPGLVTYWRQFPGILAYDMEAMIDWRTNVVYLYVYLPSHHRTGPYLLGMAMGFILTKYKPAKYRGVISRKWSYLGYAVAGIIGFWVWTIAGPWCLGDYNAWNSALYAALNRNIWAVSTCVYIGISEYGYLPEIQSIMAWPVFQISSRLAYGVYIVHSLIIERNYFLLRNPIHHDLVDEITNGVGVIVISSACAIWLWLFVEAPLSNLTNLILDPKKQKAENGIKKEQTVNDYSNGIKNGKCL